MINEKYNPRFLGVPYRQIGPSIRRAVSWRPAPRPQIANPLIRFTKYGPSLRKTFGGGWGFQAALLGPMLVGGGLSGAAEWGHNTGLSEDYIGGFTYGAMKEFGAQIGSVPGYLIGAGVGAGIGAMVGFGPLSLVGGIAGGIVGYSLGAAVTSRPAYEVGRFLSRVGRSGRLANTLQMGGNFMDTQQAFTMRQQAIMEMSGSLLNARQYLGNEASLMHDF